jgi:ABC-type uncharacterized transport system substrate-binding protein
MSTRREFITLLVGGAAAWPLAARAQQAKLPTIGLFISGTSKSHGRRVSAFLQRLRELGWVEGSNIAIEYRWTEERREPIADIVAELVRLKVDVLFTAGTSNVAAAKRATSVIPIVFAVVNDPVGSGLVTSLAQPGGNVTGLSNQQTELAGKRLALFRELVPDFRRLGIIANIGSPAAVVELREAQTAARALDFEVVLLEVRRAEDITPAFEGIRTRVQALYVVGDPLTMTNRIRINAMAMGARLPTLHGDREHVDAGGLMSYGPNFPDLFRRAGDYIDKILRGAKPNDLPVEQPTKFDLVINLITAKAIGLTIPPTLLARADEVIE